MGMEECWLTIEATTSRIGWSVVGVDQNYGIEEEPGAWALVHDQRRLSKCPRPLFSVQKMRPPVNGTGNNV